MNDEKEHCKNCGLTEFDLIDGHLYCTECFERFEEQAQQEYDTFGHETFVLDVRRGVKQKQLKKSKEQQKQQDKLENKKTSFEEYNYILRGLVDELLEIDYIPNFKITVLQIWIRFLKHLEVAFFDNDSLAHLPKLHAFFRKSDAEVLYNKKYSKKSYYKPKPKAVLDLGALAADDKKLKRKLMRKSIRNIQKIKTQESIASITDISSSNISSLSNLSLEEIEASKVGLELNIEFSTAAKEAQKRIKEYRTKRGLPRKLDEYGREKVTLRNYRHSEIAELLNGNTLIYILYSALNICGSKIQLVDLLRFSREGHISFYNFRKFLPESIADSQSLSLTQYHSLHYRKYYSFRRTLMGFYMKFGDIKLSLRLPNMMMLAQRYIADLNLPQELNVYVEKIMEILPTVLKLNKSEFVNFESRVMAYVLFTLKLIFGIDGYREKEISKSTRKINLELAKLNTGLKLFDYESWREYIEYRDVLLNKYYYPTVFKRDYRSDKPYEIFLSMLKNVRPTTFNTRNDEMKMNQIQKEHLEKKACAEDYLGKLLKLHEDENNPLNELQFHCSFTPLKDALDVIAKSNLKSLINEKILIDFSNTSCEFFFDSKKLIDIFDSHNIKIQTKKCTFPKTFCFKKSESKRLMCNRLTKKNPVSFETSSPNIWITKIKENEEEEEMQQKKDDVLYHNTEMKKVITRRKAEAIDDSEDDKQDEIIYVEEKNDSGNEAEITFVKPDFNLWHRTIKTIPFDILSSGDDINALPKSFVWLLDFASKIIHQEREFIYFELQILENELIEYHEPLELTDSALEVKEKYKKKMNNIKPALMLKGKIKHIKTIFKYSFIGKLYKKENQIT